MIHEDVYKLPPERLMELREVLSTAALAVELGAKPREVFRRAKHRARPGAERRIYERLEQAPSDGLRRLVAAVEAEFGGIK